MISWNTTQLKTEGTFIGSTMEFRTFWTRWGEITAILFQRGSLLITSTIQVGKFLDCISSICDFYLNFRLVYSRYFNEYKLRMKISLSTTDCDTVAFCGSITLRSGGQLFGHKDSGRRAGVSSHVTNQSGVLTFVYLAITIKEPN